MNVSRQGRMSLAALAVLVGSVTGSPRSGAQVTASLPSSEELLPIYREAAARYDVPWPYLAAIDRYAELTKPKSVREEAPYYGYAFHPALWSGIANPQPYDYHPFTIRLFGGLGLDGDHDGLAVPWDARDRVLAMARWIDHHVGESEVEEAVWEMFQDPVAVDRVNGFARIYQRFGWNPTGHCFPIPKRYPYTVKHTFGAGRSWGGRRIHEGVDIFAHYGTPVLASCYGYVELKGWNRYGGWRIGIRDLHNVYYYYAHLSSFAKGLRRGDVVQPGQVIGYVGSSGYGPPGTSGKFPPHLHFGLYKDTGRHEWAFNPSPLLAQWERLPQHVIYANR
ncbi:L-Ala--D-Glu endopeptidase [Alicyclobacillus cellulosilyticus]|uniref:L-Ala--D-Glu endopeptidase n=1 Tax=Alicyclobacillus cellulosilyticus TaxID=1003997 RepID=A0A917K1K5_9BACL|nr:M23 family metallopeptidase [Alicyclobacillus cellulosilyticus]GGI94990.1 L-Ala--D-Glu endopeptidase [Alicyclobacillus cellulosilyticus]